MEFFLLAFPAHFFDDIACHAGRYGEAGSRLHDYDFHQMLDAGDFRMLLAVQAEGFVQLRVEPQFVLFHISYGFPFLQAVDNDASPFGRHPEAGGRGTYGTFDKPRLGDTSVQA